MQNRSAGDNGDFEVIERGLPVNWTISRYPITSGDAEVVSDTSEKVSGERSLKIIVHRYAESDRWKPFVFQSLEADQGRTYEVSFWLRSEQCTVLMELGNEGEYHLFGGPSETERRDYAAHPRITALLSPAEIGNNEWRRFTYRYTVPETDGSLRFELKLRSTGTI